MVDEPWPPADAILVDDLNPCWKCGNWNLSWRAGGPIRPVCDDCQVLTHGVIDMNHPNYKIEGPAWSDEVEAQMIILTDRGPWDQFPTVTNGADEVIESLRDLGLLKTANTRVFYYDSEGDFAELEHDGNGKFLGFASADPHALTPKERV